MYHPNVSIAILPIYIYIYVNHFLPLNISYSVVTLRAVNFLLEDGGAKFIRNVWTFVPDNLVSHSIP
jgi:hypothetical protein